MNQCIYLLLLILGLITTACEEDPEESKIPPVFVSCIPSNGATDVDVNTSIIITFDEVVTLATNHGITINGNQANATSSLTQIKINQTLEAGTNYTINIPAGAVINTKNVPIDKATSFSFTTKNPIIINIKATPVTTNPSTQLTNLYTYLYTNYGTKIISATMSNVAWNINEAEWVKQHTGKYPAMTTVDYIHLPFSSSESGSWINYADYTFLKDWWNNNGIIAAGWHWLVPKYEGVTGTNGYTYKPEETTFSATNATIEGTWENNIVKADLAKIAGYLTLLKDQNIPVIWRPLHEAAGNTYEFNGGKAWFWWGASGAESYKKLWIYMFEYFKAQGLNNLIWVWTTQTKDNAFYPGDEYVDIIGRDIYNNSNSTDLTTQFSTIQETYSNKMVTLSECGSVAKISAQWDAGAGWSYFMPWYDYDRTKDMSSAAFTSTDHVHANADWWKDAMSKTYVIKRDDMPSLK